MMTSVFFCIIFPVENRFDGDIFFVWFDYQNQSGDHTTSMKQELESIIELTRNNLHTDDAKN